MRTRAVVARAVLALVVGAVTLAPSAAGAQAQPPPSTVPPPSTAPPTTAPPTTSPPTTAPPTTTPPPTTAPPPTTTPPTTAPPPPTTTPGAPPPPTGPPASPTPPPVEEPVGPVGIDAPVAAGGLPVGLVDGIDPGLAAVPIASDALGAADALVREAAAAVEAAVAAQRDAAAEAADLEARAAGVQRRIDDLSAVERRNADALAATRLRLQELAVAAYVGGGDEAVTAVLLASRDASEFERRELYVGLADQRLEARVEAYRQAREEASAGVAEAVAELDELRSAARAARAVAAEERAAERRWRTVLARRQQARAEATRLSWVVGADFPLVVLDAYWKASRRVAAVGCAVPWHALAGIGRVESGHGTFADSVVDEAGMVAPPIVGIPLTGEGGTARITDTDAGFFDGDPVLDRAVGPMQFIPSTWQAYAFDGDGDEAIDPQSIYDSASAAAAYVCRAAGPDLTGDESLTRAYLAYNHSDVYARTVLAYAHAYADLDLPVGEPRP